ncbi:MAG: TetR family transcriptional regulator [Bacteroidetes bacterium 4572_77]|nr:MAG: TetR family transcriptional regulator [Bacteroidetes bacterium 4572_77]
MANKIEKMMAKKDINTEQKIVKAAEKVFIEQGMSGARMQEIANVAGINKALLHYYYRSKEKLFDMVFRTAFKAFIPNLLEVFKGDEDFFSKIRYFVAKYMNVLEKNPHIPGFVLHEISNRPKHLSEMMQELNFDLSFIYDQINEEIAAGNLRAIAPEQLIINIISLCVFPIVAKPMISAIVYKGDKKAYKQMINERKTLVADFVINSIKA